MKDYRTILHLERNGIHEYFGSPSSLFDKYTSDDLGITQAGLNNFFSKNSKDHIACYVNKKCIIRKGKLYVKSSTRGRKGSVE